MPKRKTKSPKAAVQVSDAPSVAQILINVFDGRRLPLPPTVKWMARLSDGRPLSARKTQTHAGLTGPSKLFAVDFFDNFFDDYTVVVSPDGFQDFGWFPVHVHPSEPAIVDVLTLPKEGSPHFANSTWSRLLSSRAGFAEFIQRGCENAKAAEEKYGMALEKRPKSLACFLNLATAMSDIQLPSGKTPFGYYWNIAWPTGNARSADWLNRLDQVFKQDRFFCYVDANIVADLREAAKIGSFAPEKNPGIFHPDATESYKQTQFDVGNVQLTFHGADTCTLPAQDGTLVKCVKIEADIDYFKDLASHGLLEVIPHTLSGGKTEPTVAFALRWMAGKRSGLPAFNPLYTVE